MIKALLLIYILNFFFRYCCFDKINFFWIFNSFFINIYSFFIMEQKEKLICVYFSCFCFRTHLPHLSQSTVGVPARSTAGGGGSATSQQQILSGNSGAFSAYVGQPPPQSRDSSQASIRYLHQPQTTYGAIPFSRDVYVRVSIA